MKNGNCVKISVKLENKFHKKVSKFYKFWIIPHFSGFPHFPEIPLFFWIFPFSWISPFYWFSPFSWISRISPFPGFSRVNFAEPKTLQKCLLNLVSFGFSRVIFAEPKICFKYLLTKTEFVYNLYYPLQFHRNFHINLLQFI